MKFFRSELLKTELCRVCRKLKLLKTVCKSEACRSQRKLAR